MFPSSWSFWSVLLTLSVSACCLEISGYDGNQVICSKGLSDCTMKDVLPHTVEERDAVQVLNLTLHSRLCCVENRPCTLCLVIDVEIIINNAEHEEDEGFSGLDEEEEDSTELSNRNASVTVYFMAAPTYPTYKRVEFTINHTDLTVQHHTKISMVITEPAGVTFSSHVVVQSSDHSQQHFVPSLDEVCTRELQDRIKECHAPRLRVVINQKMNQVELQTVGSNRSVPSMCIQYEQNGRCQRWNRTTVPLSSVTPCLCFQVWDEDGQRSMRSLSCSFTNESFAQRNVWQNVSVSVVQVLMNNQHPMLWWNLSAPCRLEGAVWPCVREGSCREIGGFRQQLTNNTWKQSRQRLWRTTGVFEFDIDLQQSPCVMVKVKGMDHALGPFCYQNTDRCRWSLLAVGLMLLLCITVLMFYLFHNFVKKWVWSWRNGGFVEIGRRHQVVLLSPPETDATVAESVCQLGSLLCSHGFSVLVDQWRRQEQSKMGPLLWVHSQLMALRSQGGRMVLVLTRTALERAEEWTRGQGEDRPCLSPYSDVFTALLFLIQAEQRQGRAGELFLLVKLDSHPCCSDRTLPELLRGLKMFQVPSQTQALLTELTVGGAVRTWTNWRWCTSDQQKEDPETKPLKPS